jgi:hypothetical protein
VTRIDELCVPEMPLCTSLLYGAIICLFGAGLLKILFEEIGFQMFSGRWAGTLLT